MSHGHVNLWRHSLVLTRSSPAFYSLVEATCNRIKTIFYKFESRPKVTSPQKLSFSLLKNVKNRRYRLQSNCNYTFASVLQRNCCNETVPRKHFAMKLLQANCCNETVARKHVLGRVKPFFGGRESFFRRCTDANSVSS